MIPKAGKTIILLFIFVSVAWALKAQTITHFAVGAAPVTSSKNFTGGAAQPWQALTSKNQLTDGFLQADIKISSETEPGEQFENQMPVFPNPAGNRLFFFFRTKKIKRNILIYDITGRVCKQINTDRSEFSVDVSELPSGNYFLKIRRAGSKICRTFKLSII